VTRRRRARVYLRLHLGCLGCSIPLFAVLAAAVALAVTL
jgi:hypothetical protein